MRLVGDTGLLIVEILLHGCHGCALDLKHCPFQECGALGRPHLYCFGSRYAPLVVTKWLSVTIIELSGCQQFALSFLFC